MARLLVERGGQIRAVQLKPTKKGERKGIMGWAGVDEAWSWWVGARELAVRGRHDDASRPTTAFNERRDGSRGSA